MTERATLWHSVRMIRMIVIVLVIGLLGGGWWWMSREDVLDVDEKMVVLSAAREYLASNPRVESVQSSLVLEDYWEYSHLGGNPERRLGNDWFGENEPLVYPLGDDKWGVQWLGLPECSLQEPLRLGYDPVLSDGEGKRCATWWNVQVEVDNKTGERSLFISERGYGEKEL